MFGKRTFQDWYIPSQSICHFDLPGLLILPSFWLARPPEWTFRDSSQWNNWHWTQTHQKPFFFFSSLSGYLCCRDLSSSRDHRVFDGLAFFSMAAYSLCVVFWGFWYFRDSLILGQIMVYGFTLFLYTNGILEFADKYAKDLRRHIVQSIYIYTWVEIYREKSTICLSA